MTTSPRNLVRGFSLVFAFASTIPLFAQATAPVDRATLAKYDKNNNGVLDPAELQQKAADEANTKDVVALTPFTVSTDKDVGYAAGNTLSGGRVDTPLAITPGSISVMTKEFMNDFNITNMNQAGNWTIGFDLGTSVPNSDPSSISVYQNIVRGAPSDQNFPMRNGSVNFGAADSYNTERYEFSRGPDTSMFGDGGPGGRQGSTSKRATYNATATSLSTQFDTWNGYRHTLDYSKGWDRFGLRLNALYQDAPGYQSGETKIKKAWTINGIVKLTKNTQLTAEYERTNEWNHLWSITNGDAQLAWDGLTVNNDNSALLGNNNTALVAQGVRRLLDEENNGQTNMFIYNFATHDLQDYGGNQYRTVFGGNGTAIRIPYVGNEFLKAVPSRRPAIPNIDPRFSAAPKDNIAARDADNIFVNIEHRIGDLYLRVGYAKNDFDNNTIWSNTSPNGYIIDINKLLPNGQLNPRYLQVFTDVEQNNIYNQDAMNEINAQATYKFSVARWWDYKQLVSLYVSDRDTKTEGRTSAWRRTDNPANADPLSNSNRLYYRVYWKDPKADLGPIFHDPNGVIPGTWKYVDTGTGSSGSAITERGVKNARLTSQSSFFNDKLAITGSYSRDKVDVDNLNRIGTTGAPNYTNLLGNAGVAGAHFKRTETVESSAVGLVAYPFQFKNDGIVKKFVSPLGFVFNYAENNQPPPTASPSPLISGDVVPLTHSRTRDFGLRYSIEGGKVYLTLSHYNTNQNDVVGNGVGTFGSAGDITNIWTNLGYTDPKLITTVAGTGFNYSDPSSRRLEGWEAELTANPTRNITLQATYSHPITYIVKESEDRKAYVAAHRAEWEAGAKAAQGSVVNGRVIGDPTIIAGAITNIDQSLAGLSTGTLENNQVRHRISLTGRYSFMDGALKGLAFNAGATYRGHGKNGSRDARLKFNIPDSAPNPTNAQNAEAAFDYLWTPPSWKSTVVFGANYTRRFDKYTWRFQLNIDNVLDDRDPIWGRSGPVGNFSSAYTTLATNALGAGNVRQQVLTSFVNPDPRKFTFTTTVSF